MKCINKSLPQYQELLASGINPLVLDAKIIAFQESNNTNDFPTLEQLGVEAASVQTNTESTFKPQPVSKSTLNKVRDFLTKVGVDPVAVNNIQVNGVTLQANGVADPLRGLVQYINGQDETVLPEEAFHIALELLEQKDTPLLNRILTETSKQPQYQSIYNEYSTIYLKEGRPDVRKIRKEAAAKLLANALSDTQVIDTSNNKTLLLQWWDNIVSFLTNLFSNAPQNYFQEMADGLISSDNLGTVRDTLLTDVDYISQYIPQTKAEQIVTWATSDISTQEFYNNIKDLLTKEEAVQFYQISEESNRVDSNPVQKSIIDKLYSESRRIIKVITEDTNEYRRDGIPVKNRVTDKAKQSYKRLFPEDKTDSRSEFLAEYGTSIHADFENVIHRYTDKNGFIKTNTDNKVFTTDNIYDPETSEEVYSRIEGYVIELLQEYVNNPDTRDTRIIVETVVYDEKTDTAGTIDFLAIKPDGTTDILDWKSMNIDLSKNSDIPFYKVQPYRIQLGEYKRILTSNYGVKNFDKSRIIPMNLQLRIQGTEVQEVIGFQIGNPNPKLESKDYLLPVPTLDESTGIKEVDKLLKQLNALYNRIYQGKVSPEERLNKIERLNGLYYAIRKLHIQLDINPLLDYVEVLNKEADTIISIGQDLINQDPSQVQDQTIEEYYRNLISLITKYGPLESISSKSIRDMVDQPTKDRILTISQDIKDYQDNLTNSLKSVSDVYLGTKLGVTGLTLSEKDYDSFISKFRRTDRGGTKALNAFVNLKNPVISASALLQQQEYDKLLSVRSSYMDWARSKNLSPRNMFDILLQKDAANKRVNLRINRIEKDFYTEFNLKKKSKDADWFRENIDMAAYEAWLESYKADRIAFINREIWSAIPEENDAKKQERIEQLNSQTSLSKFGNGWGHWGMLQFVNPKWETKQYKELKAPGNEPAYNLYKYIQERSDKALQLGMIQPNTKNTFLPFIKKEGIAEKAVFGGQYKLLQGFYDGISVENYDQGFGVRDEVTGELIREIPVYYTSDFTGSMDMDYISLDLFENLRIFNDHLIKYDVIKSIESRVEALEMLESVKQSLQTDSKGNLIPDQDNIGQFLTKEGNIVNYNLLREHIDGIIYDRHYEDGVGNRPLFTISPKVDKLHSRINKTIGLDILPTNVGGRAVTPNKVINTLNKLFQTKVLGLNIGIPLANLVGGKMQSILNAGTFYTKGELTSAEWRVASYAFNTEEGKKLLRLIREMDPWVLHDRFRSKATTVSQVSDLDYYRDFLMAPFQLEGRLTQFSHIVAMLENAVVIDGQLHNARKYVKEKYQGTRYTTTSKEQIEKEISDLKQNNGILKISSIKDGKIDIPGLTINDPSVANYRTRIQAATKAFTGSSTSDDITRAERNIILKSVMVFKSWIVPLADNRISELKYNPGIDQWEWGRTRSLLRIFLHSGIASAANIYNIATGNKAGIDYINELLEYKREDYRKKTGMELTVESDDFTDMLIQNVRGQMLDIVFSLSMVAMLMAFASLEPEDDKDAQGYYRFTYRMLDKISDELLFYYSPLSFVQIANGSIFPGLGLITDVSNILNHITKEIVGDEETKEKAHPLKYVLKMFPITNNLQTYMAVASPDFAKEMGIRISSESRRQ